MVKPMIPRRTIVEIAANSIKSAIAAERGGADRVELCEFLEGGGVTPSFGTIAYSRDQLNIPLHVLIRPRVGDFYYGAEELEIMLRDVSMCRQLACDGVVIGALDREGNIDRDMCLRLIEAAGDMHVVFHRAFDCVIDIDRNWPALTSLGVHGLLTSGASDDANTGAQQIADYVQRNSGLEIIAGAGVTAAQVQALIHSTGVQAVHASARQLQQSNAVMRVISGLDGHFWETDQELVQQLVQAVRLADLPSQPE